MINQQKGAGKDGKEELYNGENNHKAEGDRG
jgi:hypothetical protein